MGRGNGCNGTVNSGQLWIRKSAETDLYFKCMFESKDEIRKANQLDQYFALVCSAKYLKPVRCALDPNRFIHKAHQSANHDAKSPLKQIVSFHAAGGERGISFKITRIADIMRAYADPNNKDVIGMHTS
jgi:hypothetical protein